MTDLEARVAKGVAWLDKWHPGWAEKIDLQTLDMASGCFCVAGQLFDSYLYLSEQAHWPPKKTGLEMGFNCDGDAYPVLRELWIPAVMARRNK